MGRLKDRFAKFFSFGNVKDLDPEQTVRDVHADAALAQSGHKSVLQTIHGECNESEVSSTNGGGFNQGASHVLTHNTGTTSGGITIAPGFVNSTDPLKLNSKNLLQMSVEQRDNILEELLRTLETGDQNQKNAAAESLFNSTSEDELSRQKISALGVVRPLVKLLRQEDVKGQMYAAYTLSALTSIEMSRDDMRECHAIQALINVLKNSANNVSCKGAMRALGRLARTDDCAIEIVLQGGLAPIVALLSSEDATLVRRCLIALYFIGADKAEMQCKISEVGAIPDILRLCNSTRQEVQAEAADVMKVLARSPECAAVIQQNNGLVILQHVASEGEHPKSRGCALKALQRLAEVKEYRNTIIQTGGKSLLEARTESEAEQLSLALYQMDDPYGQAHALKTIVEIVDDDPTALPHLAHAGVVESLVLLLETANQEVQALAAIVLSRMAEETAVRKRVWLAEPVKSLVKGLTEFLPQGQEGAVMCLEKLASLQEAAEQMVKESQAMAGLTNVLDFGSDDAQGAAIRTLYLLSGVHPFVLGNISTPAIISALARRCWHGTPEVQAVSLAILKEAARFHPVAVATVSSGALTAMLVLRNSGVEDLALLAQGALDELSVSDTGRRAIEDEHDVQNLVSPMLMSFGAVRWSAGAENRISTPTSCSCSPVVEAAMRAIPRGLYLHNIPANQVYGNREVSLQLPTMHALRIESPEINSLVISKLQLQRGHRFLDIGSGSGYLTCLAAHIVGPEGSAMGVDTAPGAVTYATDRSNSMAEDMQRVPPRELPQFVTRDGGTLLEDGILYNAIHVGGCLPQVWVKTLLKLLEPNGRLVACMDGNMRLFEESKSTSRTAPFSSYCYDSMTPHRRSSLRGSGNARAAGSNPKRSGSQRRASQNGHSSHAPESGGTTPPRSQPRSTGNNNAGPTSKGSSTGLAPRMEHGVPALGQMPMTPVQDLDSEQQAMAAVQKEIEDEEMNGLLVTIHDIEICRTPEGRKCRLGEGGFGVVYKALMNGVDEVAIKLVKADRPTAKDMKMFLKEVRTLANLHHRNIVQFYGACLDPHTSMFFVTELMKGGDLYSALRHHPDTMRWEKLGKKVALDVGLGINYLHSRKPPLLHRDLKSPNVLLSEEGVAKIADVGMVRSQVKDLVTAQPVMTPLWAAPEVMRHERASVKADIWSYGILIWELISGADITEYQPLAISRQMGSSNKGKIMTLPSNCPPVARRIFEQCTLLEPDRRPTSMDIVEWLRER